MSTLSFETLSFQIKKDVLQVNLLKLFSTEIPLEEIKAIDDFKITNQHTIEFNKLEQQKAETKFSFLLNKYFHSLKNKLTNNPATYIHQNSNIPLIGNVAFGIVYRNSSIIEIKPITSCNLNCLYCSVGEGLKSKKQDFVVEKDYLVEELNKLINYIAEPVEVHIGVQGEPFLYADIEPLIKDLQENDNIHTISVDTNGTLLSKETIDKISNNKLQLNFSLDAIDKDIAKKLAGVNNYNVNHVKEMIIHASKKVKTIVAPIYVPGYNDDQLEKIIEFVKPLKVKLGIQNFLPYKTGRIPTKSIPWKEFYTLLEKLEKTHNLKLKWTKEDFNVHKTKMLEKPFQEGEVINAKIKCPDRFPNTVIAVAKERNVSVPNCQYKQNKKIKVKIVRAKHNVFLGKTV